MYIMTVRRMTSGELLKYRKGLRIAGGYGPPLPGSSQFALTTPGGAQSPTHLGGGAGRDRQHAESVLGRKPASTV